LFHGKNKSIKADKYFTKSQPKKSIFDNQFNCSKDFIFQNFSVLYATIMFGKWVTKMDPHKNKQKIFLKIATVDYKC